ncbi:complex I NDUFA9 subunit family protein [Ponticaulis profundi]|uniref:Complex I NDUFA9 subunit family protein n=1 Tax=Ponticaulis profundi TaxID=2665222 RepID=A0ABW1S9V2_9PROT
MSGELVTVFGGSGFLGRYVVRELCRAGYRVRVAVRFPHLAGDMRVGGAVGQVQIVQANVRNRPSVERALEDAWGVVNLVGILVEKGQQSFEGTQALGAKNVAELAAAAGVQKFVQMSAIGADDDSDARYAKTKAQAEDAVRKYMPNAVVLRPSILFGTEDEFFNRFAEMSRFTPFMPDIGGGKTKFQPVYVGDVAKAVTASLENDAAAGETFELGGPEVLTYREVLDYILKEIDRPRWFLPLPFFIAQPLGYVMGGLFKLWPFHEPPLTGDQVRMLRSDNVVSPDAKGFEALGVSDLETIEAIVPTYLWRYRPQGQFHEPKGA